MRNLRREGTHRRAPGGAGDCKGAHGRAFRGPIALVAGGDAIPRYPALQDRYVALIESADGLDWGAATIVSPALSLLRLRLGAWLNVLPVHQDYHLRLAKKLRERPDFPQ